MHRLSLVAILTGLVLVAPCAALAQASASEAFEAGQAAFDQQDFAEARDLFARATELAPDDAGAFLWLGKAHYQLGEVRQAIAAWTRTLEISPEESYSAAMLEALRGQKAEADTRIRLIESLVGQELHVVALQQCVSLLEGQALTDAQRARTMQLKAEALLLMGQYDQVVAILTEVEQRYGEVADPGETRLLLARAKLKINTDGSVAEALEVLELIIAEDSETPAGRAAQLELALFRLSQDLSKAKADVVKDWVSAYGDHPDVDRALRTMMKAYLQLSQERSAIDHVVRMDVRLNELDREALAAADQMYRRFVRAEQTDELTGYLMANLIEPYRDRTAYVAAANGCQAILEMSLTPASRLRAMLGLAEMQREEASIEIKRMVRSAQQIGPEMPQFVLDALATVDAIRAEFPGGDRGRKWALAETIQLAGAGIARPAKVTELRPTDAWALQMMLAVLGESGSMDIRQGSGPSVRSSRSTATSSSNRPSSLPSTWPTSCWRSCRIGLIGGPCWRGAASSCVRAARRCSSARTSPMVCPRPTPN